jgi:hypothetical protein
LEKAYPLNPGVTISDLRAHKAAMIIGKNIYSDRMETRNVDDSVILFVKPIPTERYPVTDEKFFYVYGRCAIR